MLASGFAMAPEAAAVWRCGACEGSGMGLWRLPSVGPAVNLDRYDGLWPKSGRYRG